MTDEKRSAVSRKWLVHGTGNCTDCLWESQDYLTIQKKAADHARRKKHKVLVDLGYAVIYDGRKR